LPEAKNPKLAQAFVAYVLSDAGQAVIQKWVFCPSSRLMSSNRVLNHRIAKNGLRSDWLFFMPGLLLALLLGMPLLALFLYVYLAR
jgi:hypothetical protein